MNTKQRAVYRLGLVLLLLASLCPPWRGAVTVPLTPTEKTMSDCYAGYGFLFSPPRYYTFPAGEKQGYGDTQHVDFPLLACELALLGTSTALAISFLAGPKRE